MKGMVMCFIIGIVLFVCLSMCDDYQEDSQEDFYGYVNSYRYAPTYYGYLNHGYMDYDYTYPYPYSYYTPWYHGFLPSRWLY